MSNKNIVQMVILAALWGASFLFMKLSVPEFGAIAVISARVSIAAIILLPFWFLKETRSSRKVALAHLPSLFFVGVLNSAIPFVLFAYSLLFITGGIASILNATAPIWGAVVAWIWLGKRLSIAAAIGLLLGLVGVIILVGGELAVPTDGKAIAIVAAAFAPLLYGIAANYTSEALSQVSALSIAMFSQATAGVVLVPLLFFFLPESMPSIEAWLSILALAALCTSLAYLMFFNLLVDVGSTKAITVTFLVPVFGSLWGALFINEAITLTMVIGMIVILFGTALVTGVLTFRKNI